MGGKLIKFKRRVQHEKYHEKYPTNSIYSNYNNKNCYKYNPGAVKLRYLDSNSKHLKPDVQHSYTYNGVPGGWCY